MTHARQKGSLRHSSDARSDWWDAGPLWPHGGTMADPRPERLLRFGRTKKIDEVVRHKKDKKMKDKRGSGEKSGQSRKLDRRREKKRDRKSYPLRGRAGVSEGEGLSCHVLLTRLEEQDGSEDGERKDGRRRLCLKPKAKKAKQGERKEKKSLPKTKSKPSSSSHGECLHVLQPRKRRLASLNAEAVNSLLLERATDAQPAAKQARRQEEPGSSTSSTLDPDPPRTGLQGGPKASRGNVCKTSHKLEPCQSSKQAKRPKGSREESRWMSLESLDAPAPRRLAGLNAAALLKLTSSSATSKQRARTAPTATVTSDCKAPPAAAASTPKQQSRGKLRHKGGRHKQRGRKAEPVHSDCDACKSKADFEPKVEWESGSCTHRLTKPGYQSRSMLPYPLKQVKEEQLETELSPYYCCPPEGSMEYCHRLAFFLGQQPYAESDDQPLSSSMPPVKRECLVTSPSLTHPHPHTALALSPHPCLCTADHCFSSYYVHIAHPTHTGTTSGPRPLNFAPSGLCPSRMGGPKLLGPRMSHASGLAHPAYCNTVASACYGDACGMSGYTYRAMPPVTGRACSFSAGCTGCTHSIKTGEWTVELL